MKDKGFEDLLKKLNYIITNKIILRLLVLRADLTFDAVFTRTELYLCFRLGLQILKAIDSIHSVGFLHRDIKPVSILI